jgi:acyl carrier protein
MNKFEKEIIDIIAEESGLDMDDIKTDSALYDLGIDSLTALEILVVLEDKYDIRIPDNELKNTNTIMEIINVVLDRIAGKKGENN